MSTIGLVPAHTPDAPAPHRPSLVTVIRRVTLSLVIACMIPATLFLVCFEVAGVWAAILATLAWSYGAIAFRAVTRRRTSGLLIITALLVTGRTVVALLADSTWLYFLQPIISDGVIATAFLLSLASARPMVARLAGDFYPMDLELSLRPRIRRLFVHLTLLWATIAVVKAVGMLWLLESQPLNTFVLVKSISIPSLNILTAVATVAAAALVGRKEGLLGHGRDAAPAPVGP